MIRTRKGVGVVDLVGIKVVHINGRLRVQLVFADSRSRYHARSYELAVFRAAMNKIASSDRDKQSTGLKDLGLYIEKSIYHLPLDTGLLGLLGFGTSGSGGACYHLQLILHRDSPFVAQLREAIRTNRPYDVLNPWRR